VSSSAAPGACTTPSRVIHSFTTILRMWVSFLRPIVRGNLVVRPGRC
jgi:hypothetical protein